MGQRALTRGAWNVVTWGHMATVTREKELERSRLMTEYGLTRKQSAFVDETINGGHPSGNDAMKEAGYTSRSMVTKARRSERVIKATASELERKLKLEKLRVEYKKDPKNYVEGKLLAHSEDAEITPNQTRAVELLGKMNGAFIERIEIDAGEFLRSQLGRRIIPEDFQLE